MEEVEDGSQASKKRGVRGRQETEQVRDCGPAKTPDGVRERER